MWKSKELLQLLCMDDDLYKNKIARVIGLIEGYQSNYIYK